MQRATDATQRVSPAEYARLRGLNRSTISRQIHSGLIKLRKGLVDVAEADAARAANLDPDRGRRKLKPEGAAPQAQGKAAAQKESLLDARTRKESSLADLRALDAAKRRGELLDAAEVEQAWGGIISATRSALLLLPARLCQKVAPVTDPRECMAIIEKEIKATLTGLSEYQPGAPK